MDTLEQQISDMEQKLGIVLPAVYKAFLCSHSQMIFDVGILYAPAEIAERYFTLEFDRFAPAYIPIGNDNGDYELVMHSGSRIKRFGILEQGSIGTMEPARLQNFTQWYESGPTFCFAPQEEPADWSKPVKVILKRMPDPKTMLKIRNALRLDTPISALMRCADQTPALLTNSLTYAEAKKQIAAYALEDWLTID